MYKKNNKNTNNNTNNKRGTSGRSRRANRRGGLGPGRMLPPMAQRYRDLLLDPCGAELVGPVGVDYGTGLYARYKTIITPGVSGSVSGLSAVCFLDPQNHLIRVRTADQIDTTYASNVGDASDKSTSLGVLSDQISRGYRIIAGCIKWVPTGPLLQRTGVVRSYVFNESIGVGTETAARLRPIAMHSAFNGSEEHEVVYFPANSGLQFTTATDAADTSGACIALGVDGVDTVTYGLPLAESQARGYFEVTWVAEWQPAAGTGFSAVPVPPVSVTMAQMYDTIRPFAHAAVSYAARMALMRISRYMSNGSSARIRDTAHMGL